MSYKKVLITRSKNLLSIPTTLGTPSNTAFTNTTARKWTFGTYVVGFTRNNYYAPDRVTSYSVDSTSISCASPSGGYGIAIPVKLEAGKSYTLSANVDPDGYFGQTFYKEDGTLISYTTKESTAPAGKQTMTFTVPADTYYTVLLFYRLGEQTFTNIQLEEGTTATDFVPPYCTSYKKALIANTNPIQLLNPKIFKSATQNGITAVAKDGVMTLDGTATANVYLAVQTISMNVTAGHKMIITGCPAGGSWKTYTLYNSGDAVNGLDFGDGAIYTIDKDRSTYIYIFITKGQTVTNLQFKPQFYDLTAIYGAGNEPATVSAFREKFPNDIYPQNLSYCNNYESALITPTINLFDESKILKKTQHDGYWTSSANISGTTGHFYKMTVEPNTTYTVISGCYNPNYTADALLYSVQVGNSFYDYTTRLVVGLIASSNKGWNMRKYTFTVPDGITEVTFSAFTDTMFRGFMVIKGNVPLTTSYVPYQYL